jgi:hypothetical protein
MKEFLKNVAIVAVIAALFGMYTFYIKHINQKDSQEKLVDPPNTMSFASLPSGDEPSGLSQMKLVEKNDAFELFIDPLTTDMAVKERTTGHVYFTNPQNIHTQSTFKAPAPSTMSSLVVMKIMDQSGKESILSSSEDSVANQQVFYQKTDNGLKIIFKMGKDESYRLIPPVLSERVYLEYYANLDDYDKETLDEFYRLITPDTIPDDERVKLLKTYTNLPNGNFYIARTLNASTRKIIEKAFTASGLTAEVMAEESEKAGYVPDSTEVAFLLPLYVTIDNDGFTARVNVDEIKGSMSYKVTSLDLLPGFASTDRSDGFILFPDGSGCVLDLASNGRGEILSKPIFGADRTFEKKVGSYEGAQGILPVFGINYGGKSIFAVVEEGAAMANVTAKLKGNINLITSTYASFTTTQVDSASYDGLLKQPKGVVIPQGSIKGNLSVKYMFLHGEEVDYADMAILYREYLIDQGILKKIQVRKLPFYMQVLGSVSVKETRFGVPVTIRRPLTTYNQTVEMMEMLNKSGVENINVVYNGLANNGIRNSAYSEYRLIEQLGGESDYNSMMTYAKQKDFKIFPEVQLTKVYKANNTKSFSNTKSVSRKADMTLAIGIERNRATMAEMRTGRHLLVSPASLLTMFQSFANDFFRYEHTNTISLPSFGKDINSDYNKNHPIDRNSAVSYYDEVLSTAQAQDLEIMVDTGNQNTWKYVNYINNIPVGSSEENIQRESIPFAQMVLHGYINYTSIPVNGGSDISYEILKAAETGSGLSFNMMYSDNVDLYDTSVGNYYSYHYQDWIDTAISAYLKMSTALDPVLNETIMHHTTITDGVYKTTYANGMSVIVNYNYFDYRDEDIVVRSRDYVLVGGNDND